MSNHNGNNGNGEKKGSTSRGLLIALGIVGVVAGIATMGNIIERKVDDDVKRSSGRRRR